MASGVDISNICVCCMKNDGDNMDSVFTELTFVDAHMPSCSYLQLIYDCTQLKIATDVQNQMKICNDCIYSLTRAYLFRLQVHQSSKQISLILGSDDWKDPQQNGVNEVSSQTEHVTIYPCELCDNIYYDARTLKKHRNVHRWQPLKCRFCKQQFLNLINLQGHLLTFHPASQIKYSGFARKNTCPICSKLLPRRGRLESHLKMHKEDIKFLGNLEDMPYKECLLKILNETSDTDEIDDLNIDDLSPDDESLSTISEYDLFEEEHKATDSAYLEIEEIGELGNKDDFVTEVEYLDNEFEEEVEEEAEAEAEDQIEEQFEIIEQDFKGTGPISYKCESCTTANAMFSGIHKNIIHNDFEGHTCPYCQRVIKKFNNFEKHVQIHYKEAKLQKGVAKQAAGVNVKREVGRPKKDIDVATTSQIKFEPESLDVELITIDELTQIEEVEELSQSNEDEDVATYTFKDIEKDIIKLTNDESGDDDRMDNSSIDENQDDVDESTTKKLAQCPHCNKYYSSRRSLQSHIYEHHQRPKPQVAIECEICDKKYASERGLRAHQRERHNMHKVDDHKCPYCSKIVHRLDNFNRHVQSHKKQQKETEIASRKSSTYCKICEKSFLSAYYYKDHMKSHADPAFACDQCGEKFHSKIKLNSHMRVHRSAKEHLCSECGKCFSKSEYLKVHLMRHNGVKPFKCNYCEKTFVSKSEVRLHERYHTNQRIRECEICHKQFHRMTSLTIHMRTHTGERPYACPHCDKRFTQRNDMKTHVRREHTGEKFTCELCSAAFIQQYHLTQHLRQTHNMDVKSHIGRVEKVSTPITRLPIKPGRKPIKVEPQAQDDMKVTVPVIGLDVKTNTMTCNNVEIGIKPLL